MTKILTGDIPSSPYDPYKKPDKSKIKKLPEASEKVRKKVDFVQIVNKDVDGLMLFKRDLPIEIFEAKLHSKTKQTVEKITHKAEGKALEKQKSSGRVAAYDVREVRKLREHLAARKLKTHDKKEGFLRLDKLIACKQALQKKLDGIYINHPEGFRKELITKLSRYEEVIDEDFDDYIEGQVFPLKYGPQKNIPLEETLARCLKTLDKSVTVESKLDFPEEKLIISESKDFAIGLFRLIQQGMGYIDNRKSQKGGDPNYSGHLRLNVSLIDENIVIEMETDGKAGRVSKYPFFPIDYIFETLYEGSFQADDLSTKYDKSAEYDLPEDKGMSQRITVTIPIESLPKKL